jgi:hypothetical protein
MNQLKDLQDRYKHEYETYLLELEKYEKLKVEYNETLDWNRMVAYYANHENPYRYYEQGGEECLALKKMPPIPLEPEFKINPSDINLYEYYNIEKFTKSWFLTISPNWKGCVITREMLNFFIAVIESFYGNCDRFTKMDYVLENGHGKDHLHAHVVFELNTKKPGYMTPIKKGKILTEFRNCWNRLAKDNPSMDNLTIDDEWIDPVDLCKSRCALNTCLLTSPEMLKDKLDYLVEDLKPESHKNDLHHLCPLRGSRGYDGGES